MDMYAGALVASCVAAVKNLFPTGGCIWQENHGDVYPAGTKMICPGV